MSRSLTLGVVVCTLLYATTVAAAAPLRPTSRPCEACLRAGAATVPLDVPAGTPLAGYGSLARRLLIPDVLGRYPHAFWFKPHEGELEPLAARALVLEAGGVRLVWIAVDLVAVDRRFTAEVVRNVGSVVGASGGVIVSASHTHSGPGAFIDSRLMGFLAVDRLDEAIRQGLVRDIVEAVRRAFAGRVPARLGTRTAAGPAVTHGRLKHAPDRDLVVMKVVSLKDAPIAVVWNYAIHGTMLGPRNLGVSGDVMGIASRRLERDLGAPALFVNGSVGDVSPSRHGREAALAVGAQLADAVRSSWERIELSDDQTPIKVRTTRVSLPPPTLSLRNCSAHWVSRSLGVRLGGAWPDDAMLTAVSLGDTAVVTVPGEFQSALGQAVKMAARRRWRDPFIAGVSNDYLGYFVTASDYDRVSYVTCASVYGASAGERLAAAASDLLRALGEDQR